MGCILSDVSWDQLGVSGLATLYTLIQVTQLRLIRPQYPVGESSYFAPLDLLS